MLHLTSDAFKELFFSPARHPASRGTLPDCGALGASEALEREIPHIVTQAFAAFFESSGTALGGAGNEPFVR